MREALDGAARAQPRTRAAAGRGAAGARRRPAPGPVRPREVRSAHRPDGARSRHAEPRGGRGGDAGHRPGAPDGPARRAGRDVVRARQRVGRAIPRSGTTRSTPTGAWSAIDPTYAAAWNNLGLLLHRMGRYERGARLATWPRSRQDERCCEAVVQPGLARRGPGRPRGRRAVLPPGARALAGLCRRPLQSGRRARPAPAGPRTRWSTGSAISTSTPAARGRASRARTWKCSSRPGDQKD